MVFLLLVTECDQELKLLQVYVYDVFNHHFIFFWFLVLVWMQFSTSFLLSFEIEKSVVTLRRFSGPLVHRVPLK